MTFQQPSGKRRKEGQAVRGTDSGGAAGVKERVIKKKKSVGVSKDDEGMG